MRKNIIVEKWKATVHWTGGGNLVSQVDKDAYHYIFDKTGKIHNGTHAPENQIPPYPKSGYAAHCHLTNAYNIGLSLAGMAGFAMSHKHTQYPITRVQFEAMCKKAAELHLHPRFEIPINEIMTHYERGEADRLAGRKTKNIGKIDIIYLPWEPKLSRNEVGPYMRDKVKWYAKQPR